MRTSSKDHRMASVCFYFQVHQPPQLRRYSVFDTDRHYFDEHKSAETCRNLAQTCYLPANRALLETIRAQGGRFRIAYSITGTALGQIEQYAPEALAGFQELNASGCVEFLDETHYHSLSFLYSREEFRAQVEMHRRKIKQLFGQEPRVFRNTELIYNNDLAHFVSHMGYDGIVIAGAEQTLGHRSPNAVYSPPHSSRLKLLLKNHQLSDDIELRFGDRNWEQWPLTADKFAKWVSQINGSGQLCNVFLNYSALGLRQPDSTGIFDFLRHLPAAVMQNGDNVFLTPSQICDTHASIGEIDVPHMISWADEEHDLSPWLGNAMQSNALHELYKIEGAMKEKGDEQLLSDWRNLTASDHFYYMCTKYWAEGDPHKHQSPYESPYDSYINFMNVLDNVQMRLRE
jgi:alpha-amylase